MNFNDIWTLKYNPKTLEEFLLNNDIKEKISSWKDIPSNILLCGTPGIGKSSLAKFICNKFSPNSTKYINASESGTIDVLRNDIQSFMETASYDDANKIILLDEVDGSSKQFQEALRVTLEEHLDFVKFILTANDASKIIPGLKSRCRQYDLSTTLKDVFTRVVEILRSEKITVPKEQLENLKYLVNRFYPDIRKTLNEIQSNCINGVFSYNKNQCDDLGLHVKKALSNKEDVFKIRKYVIDNIEHVGNDYHGLMKSMFALYVAECEKVPALLISEYMYRSSFVIDHEVNFSALLFNLSQKSN